MFTCKASVVIDHANLSHVQIQLKGNDNSSRKEIIFALTASKCNTRSLLDKQIRASETVYLVVLPVNLFAHYPYSFALFVLPVNLFAGVKKG